MQKFKKRYGIQLDGSFEAAELDFQRCNDAYPGIMSTLASTDEHIHVSCMDASALPTNKLMSEEAFCILMRVMFYGFQAGQPHLAAT